MINTLLITLSYESDKKGRSRRPTQERRPMENTNDGTSIYS